MRYNVIIQYIMSILVGDGYYINNSGVYKLYNNNIVAVYNNTHLSYDDISKLLIDYNNGVLSLLQETFESYIIVIKDLLNKTYNSYKKNIDCLLYIKDEYKRDIVPTYSDINNVVYYKNDYNQSYDCNSYNIDNCLICAKDDYNNEYGVWGRNIDYLLCYKDVYKNKYRIWRRNIDYTLCYKNEYNQSYEHSGRNINNSAHNTQTMCSFNIKDYLQSICTNEENVQDNGTHSQFTIDDED